MKIQWIKKTKLIVRSTHQETGQHLTQSVKQILPWQEEEIDIIGKKKGYIDIQFADGSVSRDVDRGSFIIVG